jgi:hypothetical protein
MGICSARPYEFFNSIDYCFATFINVAAILIFAG